jgi:hypothetical protein
MHFDRQQLDLHHRKALRNRRPSRCCDGLEILDVTLQRPNLESVFLHLTGKELRS